MSTDRYTRDELRQFVLDQVPSAPPAEIDRLAGALLLLFRAAAALAPPPARTPVKRRQHPPEKPAAERLRLKK